MIRTAQTPLGWMPISFGSHCCLSRGSSLAINAASDWPPVFHCKLLDPEDWVTLRVAAPSEAIPSMCDDASSPTLWVRALGAAGTGMMDIWVGTVGNGDFLNLRLTRPR